MINQKGKQIPALKCVAKAAKSTKVDSKSPKQFTLVNFANLALNFSSGKLLYLVICFLLVACSDNTPRPTLVRPTAPPTPANFDSVPAAATIGSNAPPGVTIVATTVPPPAFATGAPQTTADSDAGRGFAGENLDPTTLAQLYGTPGPGKGQTGAGQPSRAQPTPTLDFTNNPTNVASLRNGSVSFLFAYRQALLKMQATAPTARLVFASAVALTANRTTWNFLFLSLSGPKMWRVLFDANGQNPPATDVSEQPAANLADYNVIDMNRVLDTDELVSRAEAAGVRTDLPVQIFSFGVDGVTRQPAFILTNTAQGKQLVLSAYTGQVLRNEFS